MSGSWAAGMDRPRHIPPQVWVAFIALFDDYDLPVELRALKAQTRRLAQQVGDEGAIEAFQARDAGCAEILRRVAADLDLAVTWRRLAKYDKRETAALLRRLVDLTASYNKERDDNIERVRRKSAEIAVAAQELSKKLRELQSIVERYGMVADPEMFDPIPTLIERCCPEPEITADILAYSRPSTSDSPPRYR